MQKQIAMIVAMVLASCFFLIGGAHAATINAASCSQSNVQTAINSSSTGDIVSIPAGNCTWSGNLSIPNSKKITLMGAGISSTVITNGSLSLAQSGSRVTALGFVNAVINADGNDFRIDHCRLTFGTWDTGINVRSRDTTPPVVLTGLIDHNELNNMRVNVEGTNYMLSEGPQQHQAWTTPLNLGGTSVYIEDNTFNTGSGGINAVDGNYGGSYAFRYNTVNGLNLEAHSSQEGGNRGIKKWEIYGNIINNPGASIYMPFRVRAGTGVIFNNSVLGNWVSAGLGFDNVRSYASAALGGGQCDGSSKWDGNQDSTGYPCRDQIGRSADNPQWNHSPAGAYTQAYVPAYTWLNKSGSSNVPVYVINSSGDHIKANRDYYDYNASFNGSSGTGAGTLASRPATCTTGVGYWATTQSTTNLTGMVGASPSTPLSGTLYTCTATNTWTAYYTPYTYPHPLQSAGSGSSVTPPPATPFEAPRNLTIQP